MIKCESMKETACKIEREREEKRGQDGRDSAGETDRQTEREREKKE